MVSKKVWNLLTQSQRQAKGAQVQLVEILIMPFISIHTFSIVKQNVWVWTGEQSHYWGPKCFACNNWSKLCLSFFPDKQGMVHKEFVSEVKRANSAVYVLVLEELPKQILRVRLQFQGPFFFFFNMVHICGHFLVWSIFVFCLLYSGRQCFLLHDHAPAFSALVLKHFLTNWSML